MAARRSRQQTGRNRSPAPANAATAFYAVLSGPLGSAVRGPTTELGPLVTLAAFHVRVNPAQHGASLLRVDFERRSVELAP